MNFFTAKFQNLNSKFIIKNISIFFMVFTLVFSPLADITDRYLPPGISKPIAQVLPQIDEVQALNISDNMILFYNPASASNDADLPSGWECISCSGQAYDNYFLVASTSFGTGGAKTHVSGATLSLNNGSSYALRDSDGTGTYAANGHSHDPLSVTDSNPSNYPKYGRLMLIKYTGSLPLTSLPDNVIAMFDSAPPSGWTTLTTWDDRIIIASDSTDPVDAGSDTHSHTLTWGSLAAGTGSRTESGGSTSIANGNHTHTAPSPSSSDTQPNVPLHASLIFATTDTDAFGGNIANFTNMVAMFDATPDSSLWEILSGSGGALENDFIEASTSYNSSSGGSNNHTHANVTSGNSGTSSANSSVSGSGSTAPRTVRNTHNHTITATMPASVDNRPPYKGIILARSKITQTTQTHFRWFNDDGGGAGGGGSLYYNPTGNGYGTVDFSINAGCSASSEWDCLDDDSADTSLSVPTSDDNTSSLQSVSATDYYILADDMIDPSATITQLDISVWATDAGNPNTSLTIGYCTTCDGANDVMGSPQAVSIASNTEYTQQFSGLTLSTTDLNNLQLVVSADGIRAQISTLYVFITYSVTPATPHAAEDVPASGSMPLEINNFHRLRFQIANNTSAIASLDRWRLEMTKAQSTFCSIKADGWDWLTVPTEPSIASHAFDLALSDYLSDGASTSSGALTAGASTFVPGYSLENRATTGFQTLNPDEYTEISFGMKPNSNAVVDDVYCFRLAHLIGNTNNVASSSYSKIASASVGAQISTTYTQNHFRWFYNNDALEPVGSVAIEDTRGDVVQSQPVRLRVNLTVGSAVLGAGELSLKLKYSESLSGPWTDVGQYNSSNLIRFYNSSGLTDGATLTGLSKLTGTDVLETYQKTNPSAVNPNTATIGQDIEYDFSINPKRATPGHTYYFRVYKSDDTPLNSYTNNPSLYIVPFVPPGSTGGGGSSNPGGQGSSGGGNPKSGGGQSGGSDATDPTGSGDSGDGTVLVGGDADGGGGASPVIFDWRWLYFWF